MAMTAIVVKTWASECVGKWLMILWSHAFTWPNANDLHNDKG